MFHFTMDAYDTIEGSSNNMYSVYECLVKVADTLSLKNVMPPFLAPYYYSINMEDGGISAFMLFEGGHITVHTFPFRSCFFADILYEREFSIFEAKESILSILNAKTNQSFSLDRGTVAEITEPSFDSAADFGPHYMITIQDIKMTFEGIYTWLDNLAPQINMEAITRPYVIYSTTKNPQYISGILVIAQSHAAVHYNIAKQIAYIDIFSCCFLKKEQIEKVIKESFGKTATFQTLIRGSKYKSANNNNMLRLDMYRKWQKNSCS